MKQTNEILNMNQSTQHPHFAVSAWMDGDIDTDMPEALLTPQGQETWALYHLIGDTLRTPGMATVSTPSLQQRIAEQLKNEPAIIAQPKPVSTAAQKTRFWGKNAWSGVAMAAALASVIWVAKPFLLPEFSGAIEQVAEIAPAPTTAIKEIALNTPLISDYVSAHRQMSGLAHVSQASYGAPR